MLQLPDFAPLRQISRSPGGTRAAIPHPPRSPSPPDLLGLKLAVAAVEAAAKAVTMAAATVAVVLVGVVGAMATRHVVPWLSEKVKAQKYSSTGVMALC
jgi:hypothetical protein